MLRFPVHLLLNLILFFFPPHLILLHPVFFQFFKPANLFQLGALQRLCCSLCPKWFFLWLPNLFTKALTPLFNISPSPSLYSYILSIIFLFCPIWYFSFLMKLNILCAVFSPFDFLLLSTLSIQGPAQCPAESNFLMILVKWMNWLEFVLANCRYIWRADPKLCSG